jgi:Fucose dissimilation pathway protein FucU
MLQGIHPLLIGPLLAYLDAAGHSDGVLVADAHFPAARLASRLIELPGTTAPEVVAAICTVLPVDDFGGAPGLELMASADGEVLEVQRELMDAAGVGPGTDTGPGTGTRFVDRFEFYDIARDAFVIVRTGETRSYGNAILRKGLVVRARAPRAATARRR